MNSIMPSLLWLLAGLPAAIVIYCLWKRLRSHDRRRSIWAEQAYRLATEMASEGFYVASPINGAQGKVTDWMITDCNDQGAVYLGLHKHEVVGKRLSALFPRTAFQQILAICAHAVTDGYYEDQYETTPDSPINVKWLHRKFLASKAGLAISLRDISAEKSYAIEVARLANEDAVTALPNRKWLGDFLPQILKSAESKVALLFIDLDDFRNVNDTLGHPIGDLLLRAAAMRMKSIVRTEDSVVRLGGDEFAIVLTSLDRNTEAAHVAELVNEILRFPLELVKGKGSITTSIGISIYPDDGDDTDTLLKSAEIAMYSAKNNGKAHHRFYESTLYENLRDRLALEQELAEAIEKDQFDLYYEPRINIASGRLCGMEALVRWKHPVRGILSPLHFIALAEATGLILKLGDLIINKAFKQIALWKKAGLPVVPVSINISAHQFNASGLSQTIVCALDQFGIDPALVQVELTESAMLGDQTSISEQLSEIRRLGIRLLIDDFGTGYSSLAQLQRLKMDILKIDRAFLSQLDKTKEGRVFVKAIISMAHALGLGVIAEGVENKAQLEILHSLSCDEAQGYYLSKPMTAEAMTRLLASSATMTRDCLPLAEY